jgi:16S rRNA processing protein RimM
MAEYFKIGKLAGAVGLQGELLLKHTLGKKTSLKGLRSVFVEETKNRFLPWFVQSSRIKSEDEIYIRFEGVNSREDAIKLVQKQVWLAEPDFKKYVAKTSPVNLLGYAIINDGEPLGPILEVIEQPHQLLCRLEIKGREALIPLNESTMRSTDHKKKQVLVSLPEGLLDIYLG